MTHTLNELTDPRRPGRPPGTTKVPPDVLPEVWIQIFLARARGRKFTGKSPSVRKACQAIAKGGGIISAVGGNQDALEAANAEREKSWPRFQLSPDGKRCTPNAAGSVFVNHTLTNANTLHAKYSQAKQIAADPKVRMFWMNLARQKLGRPPKHQGSGFRGNTSAWSPVEVVYKPSGSRGRN
jgi:hypothetical protein